MSDLVLVQPRVAIMDDLQDRPTLPLSLMMAASLACQEHRVTFIDQRIDRGWEARLRSAVRSGPLCVGVTAMTGAQILFALEVSRIVRETDPGVSIVWGGPHPTLDPEGTVRHPLVDAAVVGEGEHTLLDYVRALEGGRDLATVPALAYKDGDRVRVNARRGFSALDELPDPPFHLVDAERYVFSRRGQRCMNIAATRGCPHRCTFCFSPVESGGRWRAMSAERTLDLVRSAVERFGLGFVWFAEQESFADRERMLAIARGVGELGILWEAEAHLDDLGRLSDADLALLEQSGLSDIIIGVESGSQRMADALHKDVRVDHVPPLNRRLARHPGIHPRFSFMCSFPGETEEDLHDTLRLMDRILGDNPQASTSCLNPAIPYPGTAYLQDALANGLVPPRNLEEWAGYAPYDALACGLDGFLPWVAPERAALLRRLYIASSFLDDKSAYVTSPLVRALSSAYRPIARSRIAGMDTRLMWLEDALYSRARASVFPPATREASAGGARRRPGAGARSSPRGSGSRTRRP